MFFRRTENKKFDHKPRFYKPEEDVREKRKRRLKFRANSKSKTKMKIPIGLLLLLAIIVYFIVKLNST